MVRLAVVSRELLMGNFGPGQDDAGYIHVGGTNFAFADGHAMWANRVKYEKLTHENAHDPDRLNFDPTW